MAKYPDIPGYKIEKVLGKGGMATVYLAIQENFGRQVALKVMHKTLMEDESWAKRFQREAKTVAKLCHQSIVPVYDVGCFEQLHYMSMEYLPGGDLKDKMRKGLTVLDSIIIMKKIARGLDHAGSKGLVHRDIKPENILFRDDGSPVISDFGISRLTDSNTNITVTGSMVGTPHYMSPEQARGVEVDPRSDLYSLGVMLYELLTGDVPFTGTSAINIGIKHISEQPKRLPERLHGFQKLLDKAMAKNPDDRFQTGEEFNAALALIECSLSDEGEATVVMSQAEIQRLSGASERRVTASVDPRSTVATRRIARVRQNNANKSAGVPLSAFLNDPKKLFLAIVGVGVIVIGAIYLTRPDLNDNTPSPVVDRDMQAVLQAKTEKLLEQARTAMAEKRYFSDDQNNAQYYITSLLTIDPHHAEGRRLLQELFSHYMTVSSQKINQKDLAAAEQILKRASAIAYFVEDQVQSARLIKNNNALNLLRQQQLVRQVNEPLNDVVSIEDEVKDRQETVTREVESGRDAEDTEGAAGDDGISLSESSRVAETLSDAETAGEAAVADKANQDAASVETLSAEEQAEIDKLLWLARKAYKRGRLSKPANDNASMYYFQVLAKDGSNQKALAGMKEVFDKYGLFINGMLAEKDYARANRFYAGLSYVLSRKAELDNPSKNVEQLFLDYEIIKKSLKLAIDNALTERDERLSALLAKADRLKRKWLDNSVNASVRAIYQEALRLSPSSREAKKGLMATSDYEFTQAIGQLEQGNQTQAHQHMAIISQTTPDYPKLDELREAIRQAEINARKSKVFTEQAAELIDFNYERPGFFGSNRESRKRLRDAYELIAKARRVHPFDPTVKLLLGRLEDKYVSIVRVLIKAGDKTEARKFGQDTYSFVWDGSELARLLNRI
ncbi:MAG: hypothetical protein CSA50_07395 [Gammaproteobacteria bacterium]|nr:MAG: hypothetical protein CSA50_07395 [Gammaproteobacteria bacterium]